MTARYDHRRDLGDQSHLHQSGLISRDRAGLTLVEMLVVASVLSTLIMIMLPALDSVKESARAVQCQSNLRQMAMASAVYLEDHNGSYPIAQFLDLSTSTKVTWEITTVVENGSPTYIPGELWDGQGTIEIQQCPSFDGPDNWSDAPYSGYNYNTSYIGHGQGEAIEPPAKESHVRTPSQCALFGDGGWRSGANKFMRAPWPNPGDSTFSGRHAGTQAYRHNHTTNVAFCDGHVETISSLYTETNPSDQVDIAPDTGFLSEDNSLYDLR